MQGSNTFIFEELDQQSKDYLLAISKNKGIGFPGVYASKLNYGILCILFGILSLPIHIFISSIDQFAEPLALAMLQTALFMVTLWVQVRAFRLFGFIRTKNHFVFVDAKYYWDCNNYSARVVNIENIKSFECNFNDYYKTYEFKMDCDHGFVKITLSDEEPASKLYSLLSYKSEKTKKPTEGNFTESKWKWLYDFTFCIPDKKYLKPVDGDDGFVLDENFNNLSTKSIPDPFKAGKEKVHIGWISAFIILVVFVFVAFFKWDNLNRDDLIWEGIQSINTDEKVYWLRIYMRDHRNTLHRGEAGKQLGDKYKYIFQNIGESKSIIDKDDKSNFDLVSNRKPPVNFNNQNLPNLMPKLKNIVVPDLKLIQGLQSIVLPRMLDLQEPLFKLKVLPLDPVFPDASKLTPAITDAYINSIIGAFGSEYFILSSSLDGPAHINIVYSFFEEKNQQKIRFEVSYRQTLESEPTEKIFLEVNVPSRELKYVERAAKRLGVFTVGDQYGKWLFPN